jgi:hypothetical protein
LHLFSLYSVHHTHYFCFFSTLIFYWN